MYSWRCVLLMFCCLVPLCLCYLYVYIGRLCFSAIVSCHLATSDGVTCPHGLPSFSLRKRLIGLLAWTVNESEISVPKPSLPFCNRNFKVGQFLLCNQNCRNISYDQDSFLSTNLLRLGKSISERKTSSSTALLYSTFFQLKIVSLQRLSVIPSNILQHLYPSWSIYVWRNPQVTVHINII